MGCNSRWLAGAAVWTAAALGVSCNEVSVQAVEGSGQALCQEYYEICVNPILTQPLLVEGSNATVTCAGEGCHNIASGAGGAFKLNRAAEPRSDAMTGNYVAAKAFTNVVDPAVSKLLLEPLAGSSPTVGGHGGGDLFADPNDSRYQEIYYWISNPQVIATESCPQLDRFPNDATRRCLTDISSQ